MLHQEKRNQQPSDASIPIKKGVNRLELIVNECRTNQWVECVLCVHIRLKCGHRRIHILYIRRNIACVLQRTACSADPVLRAPKLAGIFLLPAHSLHQNTVHLTNQTTAERQLSAAAQCELRRTNIVHDIRNIPIDIYIHERVEHILKCRLCPLNLGGEQCFLANVHGDKQLHIRNTRRKPLKQCELTMRRNEEFHSLRIKHDGRVGRQGAWNKGRIGKLSCQILSLVS